jgi:hypothetical protein
MVIDMGAMVAFPVALVEAGGCGTMMKRLALITLAIAAPALAEIAAPTTGPAMRAAFPDFNVKTNQAMWHRETGKGPKGIFAEGWRDTLVRVSPRALVWFNDGKLGLITGGTRISEGQPNDCHACAGMLSFIPVAQTGRGLQVAGLARDIAEEGDWGVPGSVSPVSFPNKASGIVVVSSGGGQGYSVTVLRAWRLTSAGVSTALTPEFIALESDSTGVATGCDGRIKRPGKDCWDIKGRWQVEPTTGRLAITYTGMRNGQKVAARTVYGLGAKGYTLVSGRNPLPDV